MRHIPMLLCLPLFVLACDGGGEPTDESGGGGEDQAAIDAGSVVYGDICASCHGADGTGLFDAANLVEVTPNMTDEQIATQINEGGTNMPAQQLTEQQVSDVIAYIRATFN